MKAIDKILTTFQNSEYCFHEHFLRNLPENDPKQTERRH